MKTGAQGMSKTAKSTGEPVSFCTASRSLRPEAGFDRSLDSTERRRLARNTRRVEPGLEGGADARRDPAAHVVEHAHDREERGDQHGQRQQRLLGAAREHPVVDLEHVERRVSISSVDEVLKIAIVQNRPASPEKPSWGPDFLRLTISSWRRCARSFVA